MILYIDIETLPAPNPAAIAEIAAGIKPPRTLKKAETIAAWEKDEKPAAIEEAVAKTSFDALYGRIACIAWAFDSGPVAATSSNMSEAEALTYFYGQVSEACQINYHGGSTDKTLTVAGHNVAGFDLPFLRQRSIILGIKPPISVMAAMAAKPWDKTVADTMLMWSADREKRVSLDKLCKALGIKGKDGFDGSMVAETWPTDPQKVISYCRDDVERVRAIYSRMVFA